MFSRKIPLVAIRSGSIRWISIRFDAAIWIRTFQFVARTQFLRDSFRSQKTMVNLRNFPQFSNNRFHEIKRSYLRYMIWKNCNEEENCFKSDVKLSFKFLTHLNNHYTLNNLRTVTLIGMLFVSTSCELNCRIKDGMGGMD